MAEPARKLDNEEKYQPHLRAIPGGGETTPRKQGHLKSVDGGSGREAGDAGEAAPDSDDRLRTVGDGEAAGATPGPTSADTRESDQLGGGFTDDSDEADDTPRRRRPRLNMSRRRAIMSGGLATLLVGGALGIASITSGPLKIIHAGQLLQQFHFSNDEEFMDSRVGKLIRWARTRDAGQRRNLGFFGNLVADRYDEKLRKSGIDPVRQDSRDRIRAIVFDTNEPRAQSALDELRAREDIDINIPEPDADGKVRLELPTGFNSTRIRRSIMGSAIEGMGFRRRTSAMTKRILFRRAKIEWHPWRNIPRDVDEAFWDYVNRRREEWRERHSTGDTDTRSIDGARDEDGDGNEVRNPANDAVADEASDIVGDGDINSMKGKLTDIFQRGVGVAGAATLICALDQLGDSIPELRQAMVVLPLMRVGMDVVTMGNQAMSGQGFNLDEMGAMVTQFYDATAEPGAQEFFGARTFQAELGQNQTGADMPNGAKPNTERPQVFQVIDDITSATGVSQVCSFVTSTVGGWVVDIADWGTSGGPAQALVAAATDMLSGAVLGSFIDDIARWIAGQPLALDATGALLGNYANFGVRLAANEAAISHGGIPLSGIAEAQLDAESENIARAEFQQKSAYDRYLNPYESRSLVGRAMIKNPDLTSPTSTIATVVGAPLKALAGTVGNFASVLTPQASAQTGRYDYGFPAFGFGMDEMDSGRYDDPFENADRVEPHLAELNDRYGDCFGTVIDPDTYEIRTKVRDTGVRYDLLEDGRSTDEGDFSHCDDNSDEFRDYRFYLADMHAVKAMACYENLDQDACTEVTEGLPYEEAQPSGGGGGGTGGPCPNIPVAIGETTEVIQGSVRIRVNNCIAPQIQQMLAQAERDGINFAGSGGWRDPQQQIALRRQNCGTSQYAIYEMPSSQCSPPTARPGTSNHESGTAIDFECNGGGTVRHGDPCWNWLVANAATYGLQNFPRESWHWSVDGT